MVKGRLLIAFLLLVLLADWLVFCAPISTFGGLSHLTGTARKIRLYVKNRFLQILPDATVNGTTEETQYSILQRSSVSVGQVKIQGVATCMFLCMDAMGVLYASKEFSDSCIFNEMLEQHHHMSYSSAKHSNDKRTLYLALNKFGLPRRTQLKTGTPLGKLSSYTQTLTEPVSAEEVEDLIQKMIRASPDHHGLRHHQLCPPSSVQLQIDHQQITRSPQEQPPSQAPTTATVVTESEIRNKKKKKKRKRRRCKEGEIAEEDGCTNRLEDKRKCDDAKDPKCQLQKQPKPAAAPVTSIAKKSSKSTEQAHAQFDARRRTLLKHLHTVSNHKRPESNTNQRLTTSTTSTTTTTSTTISPLIQHLMMTEQYPDTIPDEDFVPTTGGPVVEP